MINSRQKGKRGERAFRDVLRDAGYCKAYRGQQFRGGSDSPDVVCPELPEIHWEVKCCEGGNPYNWLAQATDDCLDKDLNHNGKKAVIAHKRNQFYWLAILSMDDFLEIIRRSDLPNPAAWQARGTVQQRAGLGSEELV